MSGDARTTNSLFEEAYWLDCVAPGAWAAVEIERDGRLIGRLPYVVKRRFGLTAISRPWFTPWLGPWIRPAGAKAANELGHQHEVLAELLQRLPPAHRTQISCAPEVTNLMAFAWAGFTLHVDYTYRLLSLGDETALWDELRHNVRKSCRKAERSVAVSTGRTLADVLPVLDLTYKRQGVDFSASYPVLERIDAVMGSRNQRTIHAAEDAQGRIHAFVYIVFDDRHSFYIAGGGDPALRESGAHALAMWHAIRNAAGRSLVFDFEGSMIPGIENFFRGFGARQTPRYSAQRNSAPLQLGDALARLLRRTFRR